MMCNDGMFWCVFEAVFGFGAAIIALIVIAAMLGINFGREK